MNELHDYNELTSSEQRLIMSGRDEQLLPMLLEKWIDRDITDRLLFDVASDRINGYERKLREVSCEYAKDGSLPELTKMLSAYSVITEALLRADHGNPAEYSREQLVAIMLPSIQVTPETQGQQRVDRLEGGAASLKSAIAVERIRHAGRKWMLGEESSVVLRATVSAAIRDTLDISTADSDEEISFSQLRSIPTILDEAAHWKCLTSIAEEAKLTDLADRLTLNQTLAATQSQPVFIGL